MTLLKVTVLQAEKISFGSFKRNTIKEDDNSIFILLINTLLNKKISFNEFKIFY